MIRLYDTLSREVKPLVPSADDKIFRMYCCGPTVYGPAHIGNFRTFLLQDVLRRTLEVGGMNVHHVRNITDVDDKTIRGAREKGVPLKEFTQEWTKIFHADCAALNMLKPDVEPLATAHIQEQIDLIKRLVEKSHAYVAPDGSVYFKVSSFADYGKLSHLDRDTLKTQSATSGEAANLADEYDRESVADFALWKARKPEDGENFWASPWGDGRPGWHIECSAMTKKHLGATFDLHSGGIDLCFPHHENEIAQSETANGQPFCHHWFHCAHLMVEGRKMSKSLGNLYTLDQIIKSGWAYWPMELRYALISGHYRQPLNFTRRSLISSRSAIIKLEKYIANLLHKADLTVNQESFVNFQKSPYPGDFGIFKQTWDALCDDLNIPEALGYIFQVFKELDIKPLTLEESRINLKIIGSITYALGLKLFLEDKTYSSQISGGIKDLADDCWDAMKAGKYQQADVLKSNLRDKGYIFQSSERGFKLIPLEIDEMAKARWDARIKKDWARSDELRKQLLERGWAVKDRKDGYDLEPVP